MRRQTRKGNKKKGPKKEQSFACVLYVPVCFDKKNIMCNSKLYYVPSSNKFHNSYGQLVVVAVCLRDNPAHVSSMLAHAACTIVVRHAHA